MRIIFLIVICSITVLGISQESAVKSFEGFYNGSNLQIECKTSPITPWQKCDCIDSVSVNGKRLLNPINNGVQVALDKTPNLNIWDKVDVKIYYSKTAQLRLLNPYHFFPQKLETVDTLYVNYPFLIWETHQNFKDLRLWVQIEQYKWGDWTKVGNNINIDSDTLYQVNISDFAHAGENKFRVAVSNIEYDHFPSKELIFQVNEKKKAKAKLKKKDAKIVLNQKVDYVLYNNKEEIVLRGLSNKIDLGYVQPGTYFLYYADRIKKITLKD